MTETATIDALRDDRMADSGMETVQASIVNPAGKLPRGALQAAQEFVNEQNFALRDGQRTRAGEIEYEPRTDSDDGEIVAIRE